MIQDHWRKLSNEVLYDILPHGESEMREVKVQISKFQSHVKNAVKAQWEKN